MRSQNEVVRAMRGPEPSDSRCRGKILCFLSSMLPACSVLVAHIRFHPQPCSLSPDLGHRGKCRAKQPRQCLRAPSRFQENLRLLRGNKDTVLGGGGRAEHSQVAEGWFLLLPVEIQEGGRSVYFQSQSCIFLDALCCAKYDVGAG